MWNIAKRKKNDSKIAGYSCFSTGVIIQGDLHGNEDIRIDGTINGNISCRGKIVIGLGGIVTGDITCVDMDVSGSLTGKVQVEELLLLHTGSTYRGDALVKEILIEQGARFLGSCKMMTE